MVRIAENNNSEPVITENILQDLKKHFKHTLGFDINFRLNSDTEIIGYISNVNDFGIFGLVFNKVYILGRGAWSVGLDLRWQYINGGSNGTSLGYFTFFDGNSIDEIKTVGSVVYKL